MLIYDLNEFFISTKNIKQQKIFNFWAHKPPDELNDISYFHRYRHDAFIVIDTMIDAIYVAVKDERDKVDLNPRHCEIL